MPRNKDGLQPRIGQYIDYNTIINALLLISPPLHIYNNERLNKTNN